MLSAQRVGTRFFTYRHGAGHGSDESGGSRPDAEIVARLAPRGQEVFWAMGGAGLGLSFIDDYHARIHRIRNIQYDTGFYLRSRILSSEMEAGYYGAGHRIFRAVNVCHIHAGP